MDKYCIDDLIRFSDFFKKLLSSLYGEEANAIYAYYEKRMSSSYPKIASTQPLAFKLYCAISKFESIIFTEEEVILFDVMYNGDYHEIKRFSKNIFAEEKHFFYESQGQKDNGWRTPKSELYISKNAVNCLYVNKSNSLINHHLLSSEFLRQVEEIYQAIMRKNYVITPQTTAKILYKDIIKPLYPELSENYKIIFCRIFKGEN